MSLPYPSMVFVPLDILTAEEMNQLVANIESLSAGTGLADGAITSGKIDSETYEIQWNSHISSSSYTLTKIAGLVILSIYSLTVDNTSSSSLVIGKLPDDVIPSINVSSIGSNLQAQYVARLAITGGTGLTAGDIAVRTGSTQSSPVLNFTVIWPA